MLASVRVTPTAVTPATASASSSPTLVRMGKGRLLNHILGCRHWLIEQAFLKRPGAQPVESASTSHPRHYTNYLYGRISGNFPISRVGGSAGFHCFILGCLEAREVRHHGEFNGWWSACFFLKKKKKGVASQRRTRFVMILCSRVWDGKKFPNLLYKFSEGKVRESCLFTCIRGFFGPLGW